MKANYPGGCKSAVVNQNQQIGVDVRSLLHRPSLLRSAQRPGPGDGAHAGRTGEVQQP